jgi:hypothetical protein
MWGADVSLPLRQHGLASGSHADALGHGAKLASDARGAVYVEYLAAFVPVFLLFLGICQLSLIGAAKLVVQHAATKGVRSAIVVLEDDPKHHGGASRGSLSEGASAGNGSTSRLLGELGHGDAGAETAAASSSGGARLGAIRTASYVPLATLAPPPEWLSFGLDASAGSLAEALGSLGVSRIGFGMLLYNRAAAAVTLRAAPRSHELASEPIAAKGAVTVHVTYLYYCAVPLASRIMCKPAYELAGYGGAMHEVSRLAQAFSLTDPAATGKKLREIRSRARYRTEQARQLADELDRVESPGLGLPLLLSSARFVALEGEATLPNQGAGYY